MEGHRAKLYSLIDAFTSTIATDTFPTNTAGRNWVPEEWEVEQPERFRKVVETLYSCCFHAVGLYPIAKGRAIVQDVTLKQRTRTNSNERNRQMNLLWVIAVVLLVLWVLGLVTSTTMGGFIHLLLVIAIVTVLVRVIQGRRR